MNKEQNIPIVIVISIYLCTIAVVAAVGEARAEDIIIATVATVIVIIGILSIEP